MENDVLKSKMMEYFSTQKELCIDNQQILDILPDLLKLQNHKGLIYGRSWCKHEDLSAYFNLERKFDRISNIMGKAMKQGLDSIYSEQSSTPTETFVDTIVDLGLYALMWVGMIKELHPEEYQKFIKNNQLDK